MKKTSTITMIITFLLVLSNGLQSQNNQSKQRESGTVPVARIYHSLVYHNKTDNLLVFAGLTKRGWIGDLRDIWKYDPNTEQWKYVGICEAVSVDGKSVITTMAYDQESDQF
ncbi:MAG TPA: kelch repeat-containing protein, partial [Ignavibacteria bacterium]